MGPGFYVIAFCQKKVGVGIQVALGKLSNFRVRFHWRQRFFFIYVLHPEARLLVVPKGPKMYAYPRGPRRTVEDQQERIPLLIRWMFLWILMLKTWSIEAVMHLRAFSVRYRSNESTRPDRDVGNNSPPIVGMLFISKREAPAFRRPGIRRRKHLRDAHQSRRGI